MIKKACLSFFINKCQFKERSCGLDFAVIYLLFYKNPQITQSSVAFLNNRYLCLMIEVSYLFKCFGLNHHIQHPRSYLCCFLKYFYSEYKKQRGNDYLRLWWDLHLSISCNPQAESPQNPQIVPEDKSPALHPLSRQSVKFPQSFKFLRAVS